MEFSTLNGDSAGSVHSNSSKEGSKPTSSYLSNLCDSYGLSSAPGNKFRLAHPPIDTQSDIQSDEPSDKPSDKPRSQSVYYSGSGDIYSHVSELSRSKSVSGKPETFYFGPTRGSNLRSSSTNKTSNNAATYSEESISTDECVWVSTDNLPLPKPQVSTNSQPLENTTPKPTIIRWEDLTSLDTYETATRSDRPSLIETSVVSFEDHPTATSTSSDIYQPNNSTENPILSEVQFEEEEPEYSTVLDAQRQINTPVGVATAVETQEDNFAELLNKVPGEEELEKEEENDVYAVIKKNTIQETVNKNDSPYFFEAIKNLNNIPIDQDIPPEYISMAARSRMSKYLDTEDLDVQIIETPAKVLESKPEPVVEAPTENGHDASVAEVDDAFSFVDGAEKPIAEENSEPANEVTEEVAAEEPIPEENNEVTEEVAAEEPIPEENPEPANEVTETVAAEEPIVEEPAVDPPIVPDEKGTNHVANPVMPMIPVGGQGQHKSLERVESNSDTLKAEESSDAPTIVAEEEKSDVTDANGNLAKDDGLQDKDRVERLLAELSQGTALQKVKSSTRLLQRTFYLNMNDMTFYYDGSQKKGRDTNIRISKIREVRLGEKDYSKKFKDLDPGLCFVVFLGASHKILYLKAATKEIRDKWVRGLKYAMQMEQLAEQRSVQDKWVREAFQMADKNKDGSLDFEEILKLLNTLNANIGKKYAREMFDAADTNKNVEKGGRSVLDRDEFVNFYRALTKRVELDEIFLTYSRGKGFMTIHDILTFLRDGQKNITASEDECRVIIDNFEPDGPSKQKDQLSEIGFRNYLIADRQHMFNPAHKVVYQDMTKPMTHYFIASSHNTYLAEDQLKGPSQVEMYIESLKKGCRCVELDCWDGPNNEPVIYHGHTLTSKILFKDVIEAIEEYAFEATPYPVTLSIENHCSIDQQTVMANHMTEILGEKLWAPKADLITTPSPEDLRFKILVKGKRLPGSDAYEGDVSDEDEAENIPKEGEEAAAKEKSSSQKKSIKLSQALSNIISMKSTHFKPDSSGLPDPVFSVISLGEGKVESLVKSNPSLLNTVTHHKIIRTYPAGFRTDSSNYNPVPCWNHGCQVVALNYQTTKEWMQLNHGRFLDNGGTGYVLKPSFLMSPDHFGIVNGTVNRTTSKVLKITIISGHQIPKPNDTSKGEIIDPFIKIDVFGVDSDRAEYKTKVIDNNGFNPRWRETCSFKLRVPELAIVRMTVMDHDTTRDDFIGYYCLPVMSIQDGFRHFPLFDRFGNKFNQTLIFSHVTLNNA